MQQTHLELVFYFCLLCPNSLYACFIVCTQRWCDPSMV